MAFIDIQTNNLSRELRNTTTSSDDLVYVPGTAITGEWRQPILLSNLEEFKNQFGDHGPEGSPTFEYVAGILSSGLPVLFRRIVTENQDTLNGELPDMSKPTEPSEPTEPPEGEETVVTYTDTEEKERTCVIQARAKISHMVDGAEVVDFVVKEKFGGTFGNDMYITIRRNNSSIWLDVLLDKTLLERKRLAVISSASDENNYTINKKVYNSLINTEFDRIEITDIQEDFDAMLIEGKQRIPLSGGADFDETLVPNEIPQSYQFIYDRMLYKPKFITSGGYYDDTSTGGAFPIANAMKNLTLARQDCKAIIDLAPFTSQEDYVTTAASLSYVQDTNSTLIPSANIYGPWCYMQVGADKLWMPPSYAYLTTMGTRLLEGKKAYNPVAGLSTGIIKNVIKTEFEIGTDVAEEWQSDTEVNINPIMQMNGSVYVLGGNSTLLLPEEETGENNLFLESSADLAVIDIRRFVYNLATELQYQYNSAEAFETFGLKTSTYLDKMITEDAVTDYAIYNESTDNEPRKLKIRLDVYLTPTVKKIQILLNVGYGSIEMEGGVA